MSPGWDGGRVYIIKISPVERTKGCRVRGGLLASTGHASLACLHDPGVRLEGLDARAVVLALITRDCSYFSGRNLDVELVRSRHVSRARANSVPIPNCTLLRTHC